MIPFKSKTSTNLFAKISRLLIIQRNSFLHDDLLIFALSAQTRFLWEKPHKIESRKHASILAKSKYISAKNIYLQFHPWNNRAPFVRHHIQRIGRVNACQKECHREANGKFLESALSHPRRGRDQRSQNNHRPVCVCVCRPTTLGITSRRVRVIAEKVLTQAAKKRTRGLQRPRNRFAPRRDASFSHTPCV
jgi:hypothetical protein